MFKRLRALILSEVERCFGAAHHCVVDAAHALEVVLITVLIFSILTSSVFYFVHIYFLSAIVHYYVQTVLEFSDRYGKLEGRPQLQNISQHFYNVDTSAAIFCLLMLPITIRSKKGEDALEEWNYEFFEATEWMFFALFEIEVLVGLDEVTPTTIGFFIITFIAYFGDDARTDIGLAGLITIGLLSPIILYFFATDVRISRNGGFGHRGFWLSPFVIAALVIGYPFIAPFFLPIYKYLERFVQANDPRIDPALLPATPWVAAKYDVLANLENNPTTVWNKKRAANGRHWIFEKYFPREEGGNETDGTVKLSKAGKSERRPTEPV